MKNTLLKIFVTKNHSTFLIDELVVSLLSGCAAPSGTNYSPIINVQGIQF